MFLDSEVKYDMDRHERTFWESVDTNSKWDAERLSSLRLSRKRILNMLEDAGVREIDVECKFNIRFRGRIYESDEIVDLLEQLHDELTCNFEMTSEIMYPDLVSDKPELDGELTDDDVLRIMR